MRVRILPKCWRPDLFSSSGQSAHGPSLPHPVLPPLCPLPPQAPGPITWVLQAPVEAQGRQPMSVHWTPHLLSHANALYNTFATFLGWLKRPVHAQVKLLNVLLILCSGTLYSTGLVPANFPQNMPAKHGFNLNCQHGLSYRFAAKLCHFLLDLLQLF